VEVGRYAQLFRTILDQNVVVEPGARVGFDHDHDRARGLTVTEEGIAVAPNGATLFVADTDCHRVRRISWPANMTAPLAGLAGAPGAVDGVGSNARFQFPGGLAVAPSGATHSTSRAVAGPLPRRRRPRRHFLNLT
jgi:hypothetical protein